MKTKKRSGRKEVSVNALLIVFCILLFTIPFSVFAGGTKEVKSTDSGIKKINLVLWAGTDMVSLEEQKKVQEDWLITGFINQFQAENPGVTIELVVEPDQFEAHQIFRAAAMAKNGPDIVNLWSGLYTVALKDVAYILDGKIPEKDLNDLLGWEYLREGFSKDGSIIAYPWGSVDVVDFYYNKKIIRKAGLDFDKNPPRTTKEFDEACRKIKNLGVDAIATDEGSWPAILYLLTNYWWVQVSGFDTITRENNGEAKYIDDEGLLNALKYYQSIYTNGFVNKDTLTSTGATDRFLMGKAAMILGAYGDIEHYKSVFGDDLGIIQPPDMPNAKITNSQLGGPAQSLLIANYCEYPEMAIKFCSYLNSKEVYEKINQVRSMLPVRKDMLAKEIGADKTPMNEQFFEWSKKSTIYVDNCVEPDAMNELARMAPLVFTGRMSPEEVLMKMDMKTSER